MQGEKDRKAGKAIAFLALLGGATIAFFYYYRPASGFVALTARDAVTAREIEGIPFLLLEIGSGETVAGVLAARQDGGAVVQQPSGRRRFELVADGFRPLIFEVEILPARTVEKALLLTPREAAPGRPSLPDRP